MASAPRRRASIEEPPDMGDDRDRRLAAADVFLQHFEEREGSLRSITVDMQTVCEHVRGTQSMTSVLRTGGVVTGGVRVAVGVGLGLFILAAPLIEAQALAVVASILSGAAVAFVNIRKIIKVNRGAEKAEQLGSEFMEEVEPMRAKLEEIKRLCEDLDGKPAAAQAEKTLSDIEQLQKSLHQTSALRKRSRGLVGVGVAALKEARDFLMFIVSLFRISETHQDDSLGESIIRSADQTERIAEDFYKMKEELQRLREDRKHTERQRH